MYIILNKYKYVLFVLISIDEKQKLAVVRLDNRKQIRIDLISGIKILLKLWYPNEAKITFLQCSLCISVLVVMTVMVPFSLVIVN